MHNLADDQERLRDAFGDRRLLLRYNLHPDKRCCQVWYNAPISGLYIVFDIKDHYSLGWAIWELKRRQRTRREMLEMYARHLEHQDDSFNEKNEALSRETAELYSDYKIGKVVTSGHTKTVEC